MLIYNTIKPFFSIIIPVYNTGELLERCVESILNQELSNYEVIIINDGSTDNSEYLCRNIAKKYENFIFINKENGGLSETRNVGLLKSKGEYIIFLDSDDIIKHGSLLQLESIIVEFKDVDIFACNLIYNYRNIETSIRYSGVDKKIYTGSDFLGIQLRNQTMSMSACRNIYKLDYLLENELQFYKGILHEDEEWSPRVFLKAQRVMFVNESFYIAIARENSITLSKNLRKNAMDLVIIVEKLNEYYKNIENFELRKILLENNVEILLNAIYIGRFDKKYLIDKNNFKHIFVNAYRFRTILKIKLFNLNFHLYFLINDIIKYFHKRIDWFNHVK